MIGIDDKNDEIFSEQKNAINAKIINMGKQYGYTSSLPLELKEELEKYAARNKISKKKVIEMALERFFDYEVQKELFKSLKKIADDPALIEMTEWGMKDYARQLKVGEKN